MATAIKTSPSELQRACRDLLGGRLQTPRNDEQDRMAMPMFSAVCPGVLVIPILSRGGELKVTAGYSLAAAKRWWESPDEGGAKGDEGDGLSFPDAYDMVLACVNDVAGQFSEHGVPDREFMQRFVAIDERHPDFRAILKLYGYDLEAVDCGDEA